MASFLRDGDLSFSSYSFDVRTDRALVKIRSVLPAVIVSVVLFFLAMIVVFIRQMIKYNKKIKKINKKINKATSVQKHESEPATARKLQANEKANGME